MLTIYGNHQGGFCDRLAHRDFLTIGGMALGGLAMPQLLRAEASPTARSHKAIINVYLPGGPPHIDMWDLKPDAPAEIRGEYSPIKTNVPGMEICELFPKLATMADKFAIIRSISDSDGDHAAYQCMTGRKRGQQPPPGGWPAMGAWASKLKGNVNPSVPPHVSLMYKTGEPRWGDPGDGGFLGMGHAPFRLVGGKDNGMKSDNMVLQGVTLDRLQDRDSLRASLDHFRRQADASGSMDGLDQFAQKAMGILTSSKLADALDLSKEDPKNLEKYGVDDPAFERDGAPRMVRNFCIARRLVEAGARVVSMNFIRWDWHGGDGMNFVNSKRDFPLLDSGLSSLLADLHDRGMDRDVSVVVWGEFGRTPRLNNRNSRDHWPQANAAVIAGGGMRLGQVIGSTNKYAEHPTDRPVQFQEIFATLYAKAGLSLNTREFDLRGRPQYLVDPGIEPMRELMYSASRHLVRRTQREGSVNTTLLGRDWHHELCRRLAQTKRSLFICSPFITMDGCNLVRSNLTDAFQKAGRLAILSDLSPMHLLQQATDPRALQCLLTSVQQGALWHLSRVHAKVFIFDLSYAVVTSANLTAGGLYRNVEYGVGLSDAATVAAIHAEFEAFGKLGAEIDRGRLATYCELADEISAQVSAQIRAVTRAAKVKLKKALQSADDELLRWRSAGGKVTLVFANTIVYLLERHGPLSTVELHPLIREIHPDLCDDSIDRVIDGQHFGKRWKHWVRSAQQRLVREGRARLIDAKWQLA